MNVKDGRLVRFTVKIESSIEHHRWVQIAKWVPASLQFQKGDHLFLWELTQLMKPDLGNHTRCVVVSVQHYILTVGEEHDDKEGDVAEVWHQLVSVTFDATHFSEECLSRVVNEVAIEERQGRHGKENYWEEVTGFDFDQLGEGVWVLEDGLVPEPSMFIDDTLSKGALQLLGSF